MSTGICPFFATPPDGTFDPQALAMLKQSFIEIGLLYHRGVAVSYAKPAVNKGYIAVFLGPGHSEKLDVSPKAVAEGMAVRIDRDDSVTTTYIIEPQE